MSFLLFGMWCSYHLHLSLKRGGAALFVLILLALPGGFAILVPKSPTLGFLCFLTLGRLALVDCALTFGSAAILTGELLFCGQRTAHYS